VAWFDYFRKEAVLFPLPLNVLVGAARGLWFWLKYGYMDIPARPWDAYAQGVRDTKRQLSLQAANKHLLDG
jgi:hypothetical protein